jgi:hypothetical protein
MSKIGYPKKINTMILFKHIYAPAILCCSSYLFGAGVGEKIPRRYEISHTQQFLLGVTMMFFFVFTSYLISRQDKERKPPDKKNFKQTPK